MSTSTQQSHDHAPSVPIQLENGEHPKGSSTKHATQVGHRKLIIVGQTPPPYHGQAVAIQTMIDGLGESVDWVHVPMRFSDTVADNGKLQWRKLLHVFAIILHAGKLLIKHRGAVLYYPPAPASWVPVIRDLLILSVLRPLAGKTVFHFHAYGLGAFLQKHAWLRRLSWAWRKPDAAVVLGESGRSDAELFSPGKLHVAPYGLDMQPATRKEPQNPKVRVLYVGMLTESKGLFDLVETAALLKDCEVEFRVVGTYKFSETEQQLKDLVQRRGVGDIVNLLGQRTGDALWSEYAQADVFFFPTFFESETFGVVTVESMIHELPVVASRWRGPMDIVQDGETGFLCPSRDVQAYAERLRILIQNRDLRLEMGRAGRELYERRYRQENYTGKMRDVFLSLMKQS